MARTTIPTLAIGRTAALPALTAIPAADGGSFTQTPAQVLMLQNTDLVATRTVSVPSIYPTGGTPRVRTVSLAPAATAFIRVADSEFVQPDGTVHVNVSGAGVTAVILHMPRVYMAF